MSQILPMRMARPQYRQRILPRIAGRSFSATHAACSSKKKPRHQQVDPATAQLLSKQDDSKKAPATIRAESMRNMKDIREDLGLLPGSISPLDSVLRTAGLVTYWHRADSGCRNVRPRMGRCPVSSTTDGGELHDHSAELLEVPLHVVED
jgi:hypothetical protein